MLKVKREGGINTFDAIPFSFILRNETELEAIRDHVNRKIYTLKMNRTNEMRYAYFWEFNKCVHKALESIYVCVCVYLR